MDFNYDLNRLEVTFRISDLPKDIQSAVLSTLDINGFLQDEKLFRNLVASSIQRMPGVSPKTAKRLAYIIQGGDLLVLERDAEKNQFGLDFTLNKYRFALGTVPGKPDLPPLKPFLAREMLYSTLKPEASEPHRCTKFWISPDGKFYDIAPLKEHCTWAAHFVKSVDSCEKLLNEGWVRGGYEQGTWGGKEILICFLHTLRKESVNSDAVYKAVNIAEAVDIDIRGDYTHFLIKDWLDSGQSLGDYAGKQLLFRFRKEAAYHWSDSPTRYKDRFEVGNRVRVAREFQNEGEWECMCGNYTGYGTYNFDEILGHTGTIVKVYPSNHAKSGFSFDDYDVLLDDDSTPEGLEGFPIHLNYLSLEDVESPFSVKVKEPSKEKLDLLKKQIADAEKTDPAKAEQLYHQYESITKEAKMPSLKEIQQIVKNESWQKLREDLSWTKDNINSSVRRLHKYLGPNPSRFKKVRVLNLLNGVARGGIMTPAIERFQKRLRKQLGVGEKKADLSILDGILKRVANIAHEGKRPVVAFDIDDTLLSTFGGKIISGALDFIHAVIAYKGTVVYITSRPEKMRDATVEKLSENKFPVSGNAILYMYPEGSKKDTYTTPQFKYDTLKKINNEVGFLVGWFDNESSNANAGKALADELGQDITIVRLNTREHYPEKLLPGVKTIKDFKKEAHCGACTPLKMEAIRMLSDMYFELKNFDQKYLGQLGALSQSGDNQPFIDVLNNVLESIKDNKEIEERLRKLRQIAVTLQDVQYKLDDGEFKKEALLEQLHREERIYDDISTTSGFMPSLPGQPFWDQHSDGGGPGDYKYPIEQLYPAHTQIPEGSEQEVLPEYDAADQAFAKVPQKRYPAFLLKLLKMFKPLGKEDTKELKKKAEGILFNVDPDVKFIPSKISFEIKDDDIGGKYTATLLESAPKKYSPPLEKVKKTKEVIGPLPEEGEQAPVYWMPVRHESPRPGLRAVELEKALYQVAFDKENEKKNKLTPGLVVGDFNASEVLRYLHKGKEEEILRTWLTNKVASGKSTLLKLQELKNDPNTLDWEVRMMRQAVTDNWESALQTSKEAGGLSEKQQDLLITHLVVSLMKKQDFENALRIIDAYKMAEKGTAHYKSKIGDRLEDIKILAGKAKLGVAGSKDYNSQIDLILDGEKNFFPNIDILGASPEIKRDVISSLPAARLEKFIHSDDFIKQPFSVIAESARRFDALGKSGEDGLHALWENTELPASIRRSILDTLTRKYSAASEEYSEEAARPLRTELLEQGIFDKDPSVRTKTLSLITSPKVGFLPWTDDGRLIWNKEIADESSRYSHLRKDFFDFIEKVPLLARKEAYELIKYLPQDLVKEVKPPKFLADRTTLDERGVYEYTAEAFPWVENIVNSALNDPDITARKSVRSYFGLPEEKFGPEKSEEETKIIMPSEPPKAEVKKEVLPAKEQGGLLKKIIDKFDLNTSALQDEFLGWASKFIYDKEYDKLEDDQKTNLLKLILANPASYQKLYEKKKGLPEPEKKPEEKTDDEPPIEEDLFKEGSPLSKLDIESRQPPTTWPLSNPQVGYGAALPIAPRDEGLLLQPTQQFYGRPKGKFQTRLKELWDILFGDSSEKEDLEEDAKEKEEAINNKTAAELPKSKEEADKLLGGDDSQVALAVDYYVSSKDKKGLEEAIKASPNKETLIKILQAAQELNAPELIEEIFNLPSASGFGMEEVAVPGRGSFPGAKRYKNVPTFKGWREGDIHEHALEAFYKLKDIASLEKALQGEWYPLAIKYLIELGQEDKIKKLYEEEKKDPDKQRIIINYLGEKDVDFLEKALENKDDSVRMQAIEWLTYHRKFDILKKHLETEKSSDAKLAIKKYLATYAEGPVAEIAEHFKPEELKEKINNLIKTARDAFTLWDRYPEIREEVLKNVKVETRAEWEANQERIDRLINEKIRSQPYIKQGQEAIAELKKIAAKLPELDKKRKWLQSWIDEMKKRVTENSIRPEGMSDEAWKEQQDAVAQAQEEINKKEFQLAELSGPIDDLNFVISQLEAMETEATIKDELMWRVKTLKSFKNKFGGGKGGPGGSKDPTWIDYEAYKMIPNLSEDETFALGTKYNEEVETIKKLQKQRAEKAWERTELLRQRLGEIQKEVHSLNTKLKPYFERAQAPARADGEVKENEIKFFFDKSDNPISPEELEIDKQITQVEQLAEDQLRNAGAIEPSVQIDGDLYHIVPERWVNPGTYGDVPLYVPGTRVVRMPSVWDPLLKKLRREKKEIHRAFEQRKLEVLPLEARKVVSENKQLLSEAENLRKQMASFGVVTYAGDYLPPQEVQKKDQKAKKEYDERRLDLVKRMKESELLRKEKPEEYIKLRKDLADFEKDYKVRPIPDTPDYTYKLQWYRDRWRKPNYLTQPDLPVILPIEVRPISPRLKEQQRLQLLKEREQLVKQYGPPKNDLTPDFDWKIYEELLKKDEKVAALYWWEFHAAGGEKQWKGHLFDPSFRPPRLPSTYSLPPWQNPEAYKDAELPSELKFDAAPKKKKHE